jgi:DNA-binding FadR family transcriptional regulator
MARVDKAVTWTAGQPYRPSGAVDHVFRQLREAIENGTFPVGSRLEAEGALATRFAVSRPVVREALRACAALGLTETRVGRGTFVVSRTPSAEAPLGRYSPRELQEARPHVEVPAAGLAATRRSDEELARLTELVDQMAHEDDFARWVDLDAAFHQLVATASRNRVFGTVVAEIRDAMASQSGMLNSLEGRREESDAEHRRIVAAIADRSPEGAATAMREHLSSVEDAVARFFADDAPGT